MFNMYKCKPIKFPIPMGVRISIEQCPSTEEEEEEEELSRVLYSSAVGSLMYYMVGTRLNITH